MAVLRLLVLPDDPTARVPSFTNKELLPYGEECLTKILEAAKDILEYANSKLP